MTTDDLRRAPKKTPMTEAIPLLAALYAGLAGSTHCVAMCGGIAMMAGAGSAHPKVQVPLFNLGRILSYALAGAVGAWLFGRAAGVLPLEQARVVISVASALVLIALGLQFALGWRGLAGMERLGARVWARLAPLARRLLPLRGALPTLLLGMLWGWLPCGLVYVMLPLAWSTGSAGSGALVMLVFGLATAPAMVAVGVGGAGLRTRLRRPGVRRLAGAALVLTGSVFLAAPWLMDQLHAESSAPHQHHAVSIPHATPD